MNKNTSTIKVIEPLYKKSFKKYLVENYSVDKKILDRYADMLIARAVEFYIDSNLDGCTVDEDLYQGDDFDCDCSQEDADDGHHVGKCEYTDPDHYPNIEDSEKTLKEFFKGL